jgi:hypothetical protein
MAERRFLKLDFSKGYYFSDSREVSVPDGYARAWVNFFPAESGALLLRGSWTRGTQTGTAPTDVKSIAFSPFASPIGGIFTAERTGTDCEIRRSSTPYNAPTWNLVDTLVGTFGGSFNAHVPFASGLNRVLYGNTSFPSDRLRIWDGAAAADASTAAVAGRTIAFHKERFFSGGTDANGSRLHFSGLGVPTDWDVERYIDVRQNNGGTIVDACPVNQGLLIAKTNSLHLLEGDGPGSFNVTDIMGGEGVVGRCIVPTPYGVVIAGSSGVYLWTGGGTVDQIIPPLDWVFLDTGTLYPVYCVYVGGIVYIGSRFQNAYWAVDLRRGLRWLEFTNRTDADDTDAFHFSGVDYISVMTAAGFTADKDNNVLIGASLDGSIAPGVSHKSNNRSATDLEFPENISVNRARIILGTPGNPVTMLHVHFQLSGGTSTAPYTVTISNEAGIVQSSTLPATGEGHQRADFGLTGYSFEVTIASANAGVDLDGWQITDALLEYEVNEAR